MYSTADFYKGLKIEIENTPYIIIDFQHVKPGKGGAFVRTKLKNLLTGQILEQTFRSGIKVNKPKLEQKIVQFLYQDDTQLIFMDNKSYEQIYIHEKRLGKTIKYLIPNLNVQLIIYKNQPIRIELPTFIVMTVVNTTPGVRGDTINNSTKCAIMETNLTVQVPLFINSGDSIKIDTRTGEYIERV